MTHKVVRGDKVRLVLEVGGLRYETPFTFFSVVQGIDVGRYALASANVDLRLKSLTRNREHHVLAVVGNVMADVETLTLAPSAKS